MTRWCDMNCKEAAFPRDAGADGSGSCRTFIAIYCKKLGKIVAKNKKCEAGDKPASQGTEGNPELEQNISTDIKP